MFYCTNCQIKNDWPKGLSKSLGKCECCDANGKMCFDVPSSALSSKIKSNEELIEEVAEANYIAHRKEFTQLDLEKAYILGFLNQPTATVDRLAEQSKHLRDRINLAIRFIRNLQK